MELIKEIFCKLWYYDYHIIMNPSLVYWIYIILFTILFLENGILPAAFLPGDSLIVLSGVLIAKGTINYIPTMILLTLGASLGCWIGYLQGRWIGHSRIVQSWLSHLPKHYNQRAYILFHRHGLAALLIGRFIAFIRTILPTIAGLSGLPNVRFQIFNWISGLIWVMILLNIGYVFGKSKLFKYYECKIMNILMLIPIVLLLIGLSWIISIVIKRKMSSRKSKS